MIAALSLILVGVTLVVHQIIGRASTPFSLLQTYSVLLGVSLLVLAIDQIFIYHLRSPYRHLPCPKQKPWHKRFFKEPGHYSCMRWADTVSHNGLIRFYGRFNGERILFLSPKGFKDVHQLHPYNFEKTQMSTRPLRVLAGDTSLLCVNGDAHKATRRKTNPAFSTSTLKELVPLMWEHSKMVADVMLLRAKQTPVIETTRLYQAVGLDIIGSAGFGIQFNALTDPNNKLARKYQEAFDPKIWTVRAPLLLIFPTKVVNTLLFFSKGNRKLAGSLEWMRAYATKTINARRDQLKCENKTKPTTTTTTTTKQAKPVRDILDVTLAAEIFTTDELVDSFMTFLLGGHETTAAMMNFFTFRVSQDLDLQRRLREELYSVFPDASSPDSTITADQLAQLKLHHAVINELLRIHPAVPLIRRRCIADDAVVANLPLRKGTLIVTPISAIHLDKGYWGDDAREFRPERWLEDPALGGATELHAFEGFSYGARSCIGEKFARNEMALSIAAIVARMDLKFVGTGRNRDPDPTKMKAISYVTQRIIGGVWVEVRPVQR